MPSQPPASPRLDVGLDVGLGALNARGWVRWWACAALVWLTAAGAGCASSFQRWESRCVELVGAPVALADRGIVPAEVIAEVPAGPPFTELLVSWNIRESPGSTAVIEVRGRRQLGGSASASTRAGGAGEWGEWLRIGWQGERPSDPGVVTAPEARVDVDYLRASSVLMGAQCRVRVVKGAAVVSRLSAVATAASAADPERGVGARPARAMSSDPVEIAVPFRSQKTDRPELAGRLCSPTSVAMVLASLGVEATVLDVANRAYDPAHDLYGNWPRNIAAGFSWGVPGRLFRFSNWTQVERVLRSGRPIVASIFVEPGQLRGAPYPSTDGHLIVLRGLDRAGDVRVLDPAAGDERGGSLVYRRDDLTTVWLSNTKGTAYIFDPPSGRTSAPWLDAR